MAAKATGVKVRDEQRENHLCNKARNELDVKVHNRCRARREAKVLSVSPVQTEHKDAKLRSAEDANASSKDPKGQVNMARGCQREQGHPLRYVEERRPLSQNLTYIYIYMYIYIYRIAIMAFNGVHDHYIILMCDE